MVKQIETKEIRGVSIKTLIAIVSSTFIICGALMAFSNKITTAQTDLKNEIQLLRTEKAGDARLNELRLKSLEDNSKLFNQRLDAFEAYLKTIR